MSVTARKVQIIQPVLRQYDDKDASLTMRKRVAAYCRVSSLSDMQEDSLENQSIHYTNHIRSNPQWWFAGLYSDRGKTGTKTISRTGFNRMVSNALDGKIDLILCKSISRFARNILDTLNVVRILSEHGIKVIFEKEGINTGDMQSEFILSMLSATAQEESRSISDNITWALTKRYERGEPIFTRMLGYTRDENRAWVIIEREAHIVREAFGEFLKGNKPSQIANIFISKGYQKANGRTDWSGTAVRDVLKNERYTGDALCQKTYTKDYLSHQLIKNNGERSQYLIKNHHEAIVDRETYERVQQILSKCSKKAEIRTQKTYPLSGRLVCGECGCNFHRFDKRGVVTWRCGNRMKSRRLCKMKGIKEEDILNEVIRAFYTKYQINGLGQWKRQITSMMKELQSAISTREFEQNQLALNLERALLNESTNIINSKDTEKSTVNRIVIEEKLAKREVWWNLIDKDYGYRKAAMDKLEDLKHLSCQIKELKESIGDFKFLRAWVTLIKVVSPSCFIITWVNGYETKFRKGDDKI